MFKSYLSMCFVVPKQKMSDIDHIVFIATQNPEACVYFLHI